MCDSDPEDMCNRGCTEFDCKNNPSSNPTKEESPSYNIKDLFGYDRCCVGIFEGNNLRILPYVLTYSNARILVIILREVKLVDAIILTQLSD